MNLDAEMVKGSIVPIVLSLLQKREMYGYEMVKLVNEKTGGVLEWKEGTLYPCLHRLEADGLVGSVWREAETGKQRKYYRLRRKGLAELARHREEWKAFSGAVNVMLLGEAT